MQTPNNEERDALSNKFVSISSDQDSLGKSDNVQESTQSVGEKRHVTESANAVPLGLGMSGLERKVSL